ncbi:MAG: SUMF1/EgtB/PvdO family nonheme iron enzyme [Chloroflexi bacterium]|nr:SUMF1/EgtB/PvdO family nonheme iron enzyme [Chloroflexota bacterium]
MVNQFPFSLGPYTLFRELGRGGFATVYLGRDEKNQRDVAVKALDPKLADDPTFITRFQQEFKLTSKLDHPNIVRSLDYGEAQGRFYIAMTLVRGFDLRTRLHDSGALAVPMVLRIAAQVAGALDYAHAQGVVHRDVKSANILLDEDGRAYLSDFGLMRGIEGSAYMSTISQSQSFIGTAEYLSPEQACGQPATERSDLYSFGVVVFEMLTGQIPFRANTPVAVVRMHADAPPPNPLDLRADLPPALAAQVLRALAKRPADRPKHATAFVQALQAALSAEQQATAEKTAKLMQVRETAVAQARARIEALQRQKEEAERAQRLAEAQAAQLDQLAGETETLLKELQQEQAQARQAALEAEEARRKADEKQRAAQTRLTHAERSLERFQSGDEIVLQLAQGIELVLVRVPAGEFAMGSGNNDGHAEAKEKPQHTVELDEYYIGKYPVTVLQFWAFVKATGYQITVSGNVNQKGNHPITGVNWDDAVAFCKWASQVNGTEIRLPTEAQWEKAARGTDGRIYPWGNNAPSPNLCNFGNNVGTKTPVGKYNSHGDSPYKCVDMAGNVWDWCADWWDEAYYQKSPAKNPAGPESGQYRVLRGGRVQPRCYERPLRLSLLQPSRLPSRVLRFSGLCVAHPPLISGSLNSESLIARGSTRGHTAPPRGKMKNGKNRP